MPGCPGTIPRARRERAYACEGQDADQVRVTQQRERREHRGQHDLRGRGGTASVVGRAHARSRSGAAKLSVRQR